MGFERQLREDSQALRNYVSNIIRDKKLHANKDEEEQNRDLLSLYLKFAEIKSSQSYLKEDEYLQDCVLNFMVAGR